MAVGLAAVVVVPVDSALELTLVLLLALLTLLPLVQVEAAAQDQARLLEDQQEVIVYSVPLLPLAAEAAEPLIQVHWQHRAVETAVPAVAAGATLALMAPVELEIHRLFLLLKVAMEEGVIQQITDMLAAVVAHRQ